MPDFASRLKQIRIERKVTQKELAAYLNVSQNAVFNWENGKREPPIKTISEIAEYFNVSADYLMTGEEKQGYYLNEETAKLAQEMFEDEDMRSLFDMKRNMPPERFKAHMEFMKNLYEQEKGAH